MKANEPDVKTMITPALGDEEVRELFLDEWERKLGGGEEEEQDTDFKPNQNKDYGKEDFRSY